MIPDYLERCLEKVFGQNMVIEIGRLGMSNCLTIKVPNLTVDLVRSMWNVIVLDLSSRSVVRGILEVPMQWISANCVAVWVKDQVIVFCDTKANDLDFDAILIEKPLLPYSISLAIGGPSGAGKTSLIKELKISSVGNRVRTYTAYTTRPKRKHEINGVDYYFVDSSELEKYQKDPRFVNFVEARGYWYWTDPTIFFESKWKDEGAIHVFTITQAHEFWERQIIIPDLRWVWLHADEKDLCIRLEKRGGEDIEGSLRHNIKLEQQDRSKIVSLHIPTKTGDIGFSLSRLLSFIKLLDERRRI